MAGELITLQTATATKAGIRMANLTAKASIIVPMVIVTMVAGQKEVRPADGYTELAAQENG